MNRAELIKHIDEKEKNLEFAKRELKEYFVGLDSIIDRVIENVKIWYIMPELLTHPVIINLWGMTGVGKTALVRMLVELLEFADRFEEVQLTNSGSIGSSSSWSNRISGILSSSNISPKEAGILLLDEIQRFRTVNEEDRDIHDYK
jgi:cell division protease FtsH